MTRMLYRRLILLHPPQFRRRFGDEMLCIFDEAGTKGTLALFFDGVISVLRQWIFRSGSWKLVAALAGALMQITLAGLGWQGAIDLVMTNPALQGGTEVSPQIGMLLLLSAGVLAAIMMGVTAVAVWIGSFTARRIGRTAVKRQL